MNKKNRRIMKSLIYLCVQVFVLSVALNDTELGLKRWNSFKVRHSKLYKTAEEELRRMKIYLKNEIMIAEHNRHFREGKETYEIGINEFADLTEEEFNELHLPEYDPDEDDRVPFKAVPVFRDVINPNSSLRDPPEYKNWAEEGYVLPPIKDQGRCGSCWAFTAARAIETHVAIGGGKKQYLSPQNLVDCVTESNGCKGGLEKKAFDYVIRNQGIATEESYPYVAKQGECRYEPSFKGASIQGYKFVESEEAMKQVVGTVGPVTCTIIATPLKRLFLYRSGIVSSSTCEHTKKSRNHALVIVGYGEESVVRNGTRSKMDYWWIKNSWGVKWGIKGYGKLARNVNMCGVARRVTYPIGAK